MFYENAEVFQNVNDIFCGIQFDIKLLLYHPHTPL